MNPETVSAGASGSMELLKALAPFVAALISGVAAFYGARHSQSYAHKLKVKSLATGLNAEIQLFTEMVKKRRQEEWVVGQIGRLERGLSVGPPSFIRHDEKPLEQFSYFQAQMTEIGALGPVLGSNVSRWYSQVGMIRATLIDWAAGGYSRMPHGDFALVLKDELALWHETKDLAADLDKSLRTVAITGTVPNA